jgi:hypothetical protein
VLLPCGLPADAVSGIVRRHVGLFARDDGWPRSLARETGAGFEPAADESPKRRRR